MAMKWLVARRFPRVLTLTVHLDTTKTIPDPTPGAPQGATIPDPEWVLEAVYPLGKGERRQAGETLAAYATRIAAYLANIRADLHLRADARLAELTDLHDPGIALSGEGQTF